MGIPRKGWHQLKKQFRYLDNETVLGVSLNGTPGITAAAGMTVEEDGAHAFRRTRFTFVNVPFTLVDEAGVVAYVGRKFYDMPAGLINHLGSRADLALTKSSAGVNDTWDGDFGVGTVIAGNNNALATTEQNIIPTTATPQAVAGATTAKGKSTDTEANKLHDGTATPVALYLNFLVDDADHDVTTTPCNLIVNGTIDVFWVNIGDI